MLLYSFILLQVKILLHKSYLSWDHNFMWDFVNSIKFYFNRIHSKYLSPDQTQKNCFREHTSFYANLIHQDLVSFLKTRIHTFYYYISVVPNTNQHIILNVNGKWLPLTIPTLQPPLQNVISKYFIRPKKFKWAYLFFPLSSL